MVKNGTYVQIFHFMTVWLNKHKVETRWQQDTGTYAFLHLVKETPVTTELGLKHFAGSIVPKQMNSAMSPDSYLYCIILYFIEHCIERNLIQFQYFAI